MSPQRGTSTPRRAAGSSSKAAPARSPPPHPLMLGAAMPISQRELQELVAAGVIDAGTAERIAAHFKGTHAEPPRFDLTHTAYYLGALVVMSALGWFMNEAWARYGGGVLTLIAVAYAVAFSVAGESLWRKPGLRQPGGRSRSSPSRWPSPSGFCRSIWPPCSSGRRASSLLSRSR